MPGLRVPRNVCLAAARLIALALLLAAIGDTLAFAQNPIASRWANARIRGEEIGFLLQSTQITAEEARLRTAAMNTELQAIRTLLNAFPRQVQVDITQETERLFATRIIPLREQWKQALLLKAQEDRALDAQRRTELQADADVAGKLQANRTLLRERAQRGEISNAEMANADREAEQQILALHRRYDAYGPAWGRLFTQTEARVAAGAVATGRLRLRLDDTTTPLGRDAHRAADLTLSMQRNQVFQARQALTPQEAQNLNATAQALLTTLQQKYAASPEAADFRDRVVRLVQEGAAAQRPQWETEAVAAREAVLARGRAAAAAAAAGPTPARGGAAPATAPAAVNAGLPQLTPDTTSPQLTPNGVSPQLTPDDSLGPPAQGAARGVATQPAVAAARATGPASAGRRGQPNITARGATPAVMPTVVLPSSPAPTDDGFNWAAVGAFSWPAVIVLLLVGGATAGVYVLRAWRASSPPKYTPPPYVEPSRPDTPVPLRKAESSRPAVPNAAASSPPTASLKERLFAEQRQKYQSRYNDALDEVTAASRALTDLAPVLNATHRNVQLLAKTLHNRMEALVVASKGSVVKLVMNAAILMPVWRLFRKGGILLKLVILFGVWSFIGSMAQAVDQGFPWGAAGMYGLAFAIAFVIERYFSRRTLLEVVKRQGSDLKAVGLSYAFTDQRPDVHDGMPVYHGVCVRATDASPVARDQRTPEVLGTGVFLVEIGDAAIYRMDPSSVGLVSSDAGNPLATEYGDLLTQVMNEQSGFATSTLEPFAQYGQALWRKQRAASRLPQLEKLVKDIDRIEEIWRDTWVSDPVFEFLFRAIDMFNMHDTATPPGLLLHGLPGNGKKHLARKIADTISARFEQITPSKISTPERIAEVWQKARGGEPVVLFVPNAEAVFPRGPDGVSARDTLEWVAEWEKHDPRESRVWVVMTARSDDVVDPAILDHVGRDAKIEITPPDTTAGRRALFELACRQYQLSTAPPDTTVRATGGASVQDIRRIVMAAKRAASPQDPQEKHWAQAVQTVRGVDPRVRDETKTWDRLVLPPKIKERLQVACKILQDAQEYMKKGAKVENILLYGPPGTGKTEIARTIANEGGVNFMDQKLSDLKGEYQGQAVQNVRRMFEKARGMAPTVIFIDEIDGVGKQRGGGGGDSYTEDIINELLMQMEGATKSDRPVFILAATNLPQTLDPALLRRFHHRIEIPLPDEDARREILIRLLREKTLAPALDADDLAAAVAKRTNGQSGAALRDVIDRAMTRAVGLARTPDDVLLTRELVMDEVDELASLASDKVDASARWETLVVSDDTMTQLRQLSDALRHMETLQRQGIDPARGAVLYGPPGTGKTQIAKTLANESDVPFLSKTGADMVTAAAVRAVFADARSKAPCILFLDEFEKAGESRDTGGSSEVVLELIAQMQGAKKDERPVFVLAATNYLDRLDDAVLSRFTYQIEVPNPTLEQREKLFAGVLMRYPRAEFDVPALAAELARKGGGLSGRDINDVVVRAAQSAAQRAIVGGTADKVVLTREDVVREVANLIKKRSDAVDQTARWDTLVLADETMTTLKKISNAVRNMEDRLKRGQDPPRAAVLFGPPGTGKTQIARTLANESGVQFVSAAAKDLTGQYVGESTQKVAKLFAEARKKAPCILFLDEFDSATGSRSGGHTGSGFSGEVVPQVLAEMDGVKDTGRPVFVLAATNYLEHIDEAVRSRFSYKVEVPSPTPEQRERICAVFLRKLPRVDFNVEEMADELMRRAGAMSGREIADLVRKAGLSAADRAEAAGNPDEVVVTREDVLSLLTPAGRQISESDVAAVWSEIVLKPEVKQTLLGMIRLFNSGSKAAPRGLLLYGPPGTGKTEIGRLLAKSTASEFLKADLTTLKGMYQGEGARRVKELWDKARVLGRAVIFVDECDGLFARRGGLNADAAVEEVTNAFLPMWDGLDSKGQIWVVGATNKRERIDEAIDSRFGEKLEIGLPDASERLQILALEMRKLESSIAVPEFAGSATAGLSGRNLAKIAAAVYRLADQHGGQATDEMWRKVIGELATSSGDPVDPKARWDTLILPDGLIRRLKRMSEMLKHAETLRQQGIDPPRSALLFGPPGTGKTQIARTLANESGLNFISAGPSDIKGAHLGESGKMVRELFERGRAKPTVLFIDEIEAGAPSRNGGRADQYTIEIVTELLTQMDGVKSTTGTLFVLAATNHPQLVDDALISRFDERVEIPNPGLDERRRMIRTFIGKRRVDFDVEVAAEEVAARSEGLSGRDLMTLVRLASQQSAERAIDAGTPDQVVMTRTDLMNQLART